VQLVVIVDEHANWKWSKLHIGGSSSQIATLMLAR
jgi:hypothetical protein